MDHGHHSSGDGMEEPMCKMSMLFNWDPTDLCIIFPSWHIRSTLSLILSLIAIALLTAGYEAVRELSRRYEQRAARFSRGDGGNTPERGYSRSRSSGQRGYGNENGGEGRRGSKTVKALLYALQVFYSFFIMLLFMTYNGWVMIAVAVGAFLGYMVFGSNSSGATKSVACH